MSVTATIRAHMDTVKTLTGPFVDPTDATVRVNGLDQTLSLSASSTQPITEVVTQELALSSGAATIDLTSLPDLAGVAGAVDGTGLKVQAVLFQNDSANANDMTLSQGLSNDYELLGATFSFTLKPGQWVLVFLNDASPDIASGDKEIDVAGTGAQILNYHLLLG
jgi:hypothetical protein